MTSAEIDTAMRSRCPVVYNGITYRRITEYISWYDAAGQHKLSAVLLDQNGKCTVRVAAERVELYENGGKNGMD